MAIAANVSDFARDDKMMLRIDRNLHVVADNPSVLAARCNRPHNQDRPLANPFRLGRPRSFVHIPIRPKPIETEMALDHVGQCFCCRRLDCGVGSFFLVCGQFRQTYGSLGAVVGLMIWLWLSTIVILVGAELDAEMEHRTARDTTTGPPKPLGARGATVADRVGAAQH